MHDFKTEIYQELRFLKKIFAPAGNNIYKKALVSWLTVYLQLGAKVLHVGLAGAR